VHDTVLPEHTPDHLLNLRLFKGVAVNVITLPSGKVFWHEFGQLMPAGMLTTPPFPLTEILSFIIFGGCIKLFVVWKLINCPLISPEGNVPETLSV
jgi:hypothetical protein